MDRLPGLILAAIVAGVSGCMVIPPEVAPHRGGATRGPPEPDLALGATWTGWDDACTPATAFHRLAGWTVAVEPPGATCRLVRLAIPFSGGRVVASLTASSPTPIATVSLRPPAPVLLREPFDTLELRAGSRLAEGAGPAGAAASTRIEVRIEDARGTAVRVPLGAFASGRWTILRARIPEAFARTAAPPFRATSFEVRDWRAPASDELFLAGFSAYLEQSVPIVPDWRAAAPRTAWEPPLRRAIRAAMAGEPGPVTAVPPVDPFRRRIESAGPGRFVLHTADEAGETSYTIEVADWFRGGEIAWNGRPCGRWSGWEIDAAGFDAAPRVAAMSGDRLRLETVGGLSVTFRTEGRALCVEMSGGGRTIRALHPGQIRPSSPLLGIELPMLAGPRLLMWRCSDPVGTPVFATAYFDPSASGASRMDLGSATGPDRPGSCIYDPGTDGLRQEVREIFRIALSARVGDVLPRVAPSRGPPAPDFAGAAWMDADGTDTTRLRAAWSAAGAGPLILLPPAEGRGPTLADDGIDCLDPHWSRDYVRRAPDGSWVDGSSPGRFALKTPFLSMLAGAEPAAASNELPAAVRPRFTASPPWTFTDYDARSPGAATFRAAWEGLADWTRAEARRQSAPVVVAAPRAWIYAGIADAYAVGDDDAAAGRGDAWLPLAPHLCLNAVLRGIGPAFPPPSGPADDADHRHLAAMFAHGLATRLPALDPGDERLWRLVFLSTALQRRQALRAVDRIAFGDGRQLMSASDALSSGTWRRSLVYLHYPDGLEIWVNGSREPWEVRIGADLVDIPAAGWYAAGSGFTCASVRFDGHRIDYVRAPEYLYHDGHGAEAYVEGLSCAVPVIVRTGVRERTRTLSFRFPGAGARIGLAAPLLPDGARIRRAAALGSDGSAQPAPTLLPDGPRTWIVPSADARSLELEWTD